MTSFPVKGVLGLLSLEWIAFAFGLALLFLALSRLAWRGALCRYVSVSS
jgi:ABC-type uncharacterized transport system permease subunit